MRLMLLHPAVVELLAAQIVTASTVCLAPADCTGQCCHDWLDCGNVRAGS